MATEFAATNAASSGVKLDRKIIKELSRRSDTPGLIYLAQWLGSLLATGYLVWLSLGTWWVWPAMVVYGTFLCVPTYAISHETAHGTAFRSRWLNEAVLWVTSLIYFEEPLHRRYTHTNHHTHTWHVGLDSQMPFDTPMDFKGWVAEISGFALTRLDLKTFWQLATKRYSDMALMVTPEAELPKLTRGARSFIAIYGGIAALIIAGYTWPLWFLVLPRILGAPVMLLFTLIQHVETQENSPSILESTRSFRTTWLGRFLYLNMNNHVEHHLYTQMPFHALPALSEAVKDRCPSLTPVFGARILKCSRSSSDVRGARTPRPGLSGRRLT